MSDAESPRESRETVSPPPAAQQVVTAPPQIIIQQTGSTPWAFRMLAIVGWLGFAVCGLWAVGQMIAFAGYFDTSQGLTEKYHSGARLAGKKVAILHVDGVILDGDGFVKRQIDRVRDDDDVKAVIVRVNSPGGTITGSDYIYHHLSKLREERNIPLVVSMGSIAASGGYYVAMAVGDQNDSIYAEPTTTTGSIGVIVPHYDISGLLSRLDVKDDSIASHPRKQMLSMTRPLSEDDRFIVERYVNEAYVRFKQIVLSGRPEYRDDEEQLDKLATGEVFTANQAIENGLVDQIGFIEEAIERAMKLGNLSAAKTRVVEFERPLALSDLFTLGRVSSDPQSEFAAMLDLTVPRGYYLYTALPAMATSYRQLLAR